MKKITITDLIHCALIIALLCISAFIRIPFPLVPLSLQTMIVLLSGLVFGPKKAALSVAVYILMGLFGLPVFTSGGGFAYVFKPTFGYLLGMIPAAYAAGAIASGSRNFTRNLLACAAGTLLIYLIGVPYFYAIANHVMGLNKTFASVLYSGFLITLPGDILKAVAASFAALKIPSQTKK